MAATLFLTGLSIVENRLVLGQGQSKLKSTLPQSSAQHWPSISLQKSPPHQPQVNNPVVQKNFPSSTVILPINAPISFNTSFDHITALPLKSIDHSLINQVQIKSTPSSSIKSVDLSNNEKLCSDDEQIRPDSILDLKEQSKAVIDGTIRVVTEGIGRIGLTNEMGDVIASSTIAKIKELAETFVNSVATLIHNQYSKSSVILPMSPINVTTVDATVLPFTQIRRSVTDDSKSSRNSAKFSQSIASTQLVTRTQSAPTITLFRSNSLFEQSRRSPLADIISNPSPSSVSPDFSRKSFVRSSIEDVVAKKSRLDKEQVKIASAIPLPVSPSRVPINRDESTTSPITSSLIDIFSGKPIEPIVVDPVPITYPIFPISTTTSPGSVINAGIPPPLKNTPLEPVQFGVKHGVNMPTSPGRRSFVPIDPDLSNSVEVVGSPNPLMKLLGMTARTSTPRTSTITAISRNSSPAKKFSSPSVTPIKSPSKSIRNFPSPNNINKALLFNNLSPASISKIDDDILETPSNDSHSD